MSDGKFQETLPCGGKLTVFQEAWSIEYYFPGPDMRYNGEFFTIRGEELESYIENLIECFRKYEELVDAFGDGEEFVKHAPKGLTIRAGGYRRGVCVKSYHLCISTSERLETVIGGYRYAQARGPKIQSLLHSL